MKYQVQIASADNADRYDDDAMGEAWETVASGDNYQEVLEFLIEAFNNEETPDSNSWLRLLINGKEVLNY
jgi:hypothetical protein